MDRHLGIATWINLGLGALASATGLATMLVGIALGAWEGDVEAFAWLFVFGSAAAAPGLPWLVGGWGLLNGREWGRTTLIALSFLALLAIPFGTVLGWYTLWVLMNPETRRLLALRRGGHVPALREGAYHPAAGFAEAPRAGVAESVETPRAAG